MNMRRTLVFAVLGFALAWGVSPARANNYLIVCSPGWCAGSDGLMAPPGSALARVTGVASAPTGLPAGEVAIVDDGRPLYLPATHPPITVPSITTYSLSAAGALTIGATGGNQLTLSGNASASGAATIGVSGTGGISSAAAWTLTGSGTDLALSGNATIAGNLTGLQSLSITSGVASLNVGGVATAGEFAGNILYAGRQGTLTLSGSSQTFPQQTAFWSNSNITGTFTGTQSAVVNQIDIPSDTLVASSGGLSYLDVTGNVNSGFTGNRAAISAELSISGTNGTVANDSERQWQAQILTAQITANQGGTAPTRGSSAGFIYSGGDQTWCYSGATDLSGCIGREIDVGIQTGASAAERFGLSIFSDYNLQGNDRDSAIYIGSVTGSPGWKAGITFQSVSGAAYGSFLTYDTGPGAAPVSVAYGINWTGVTFSTASLALPGFTVDPTGNITIAAPATGTAASYACFTSGGKIISSATAC